MIASVVMANEGRSKSGRLAILPGSGHWHGTATRRTASQAHLAGLINRQSNRARPLCVAYLFVDDGGPATGPDPLPSFQSAISALQSGRFLGRRAGYLASSVKAGPAPNTARNGAPMSAAITAHCAAVDTPDFSQSLRRET